MVVVQILGRIWQLGTQHARGALGKSMCKAAVVHSLCSRLLRPYS